MERHEGEYFNYFWVNRPFKTEVAVCMLLDKVVLAETQYSCHIVSLLIPREGSDNMTE